MKRLILLNGPPRCGKDTLVSQLVPYLKFAHLKFAAPLKRMVAGALDMTLGGVEDRKDQKSRMLQKRDTITEDGQDSIRELLIYLSEECLKPRYGTDVFGRWFWNDVRNTASNLIIASDCGFRDEVQTVIERAGPNNCLLIRIHRDDCTYDFDSRSYMPDGLCDTRDLYNVRDLHHLTAVGLRMITQRFTDVEMQKGFEWVKVR